MTTLFKNLRPLLLSLLIFALVAGGTPVTLETFAKWGRPTVSRKKNKRYRRHSRAWWRRYRARQRARRERAEQRRLERAAALAAQGIDTTGMAGGSTKRPVNQSGAGSALAVSAPRLPFDAKLPRTWTDGRKGAGGEVTFAVRTEDGRAAGTAVLMPFDVPAAATAASYVGPRTKTLGGAPVAALRRTVIDRMVAQGGWVVNDMVREMNGRRVFVVIAQTGTPGSPDKLLTFYFTEVDGRIYTLATATPVEFAEPVAASSEQVMNTLRSAGSSNVAKQQ